MNGMIQECFTVSEKSFRYVFRPFCPFFNQFRQNNSNARFNARFAKITVFTESTLCSVLSMLGCNGGAFLRFQLLAILLVKFWTIEENKFKQPFESA